MKSLLLHAVGLLVAVSPLQALPLRFLAWDEEVAMRKVAVVAGSENSLIENLHPLQRTKAVNATPAQGGQVLLRALDRKDEEGTDIDFPLKIASGIRNGLVLLLPDARAPSGLRGFAIEDSDTSFPWGSFRILNATGKPLGVIMGKERRAVPSGWVPVDFKPPVATPLPVQFVDPAAPTTDLFSAVWKSDANVRRLVIVVPGTEARLGPLALKIIPEDRRDLAAAASAAKAD